MTTAYDLTVATVITIISIVIHRIGVELFQPGSPLYEIATDGTQVMNGQAVADLWFLILSIWVPLIATIGIWVWVLFRAYKRQAISAAQPLR